MGHISMWNGATYVCVLKYLCAFLRRFKFKFLAAMELIKSSPQICPIDQHCWQWARKYLKYCLCSTKDGVSLTLGLISVLSWGVAEIPQIITNYKDKSAEGLSIAFLMTWVVGDFLNLFGCMLEPATLYTVTTLSLVSQAIYFGHIYPRLKLNRQAETVEKEGQHNNEVGKIQVDDTNEWGNGSKTIASGVALSTPIPLPAGARNGSIDREFYYMSARSLSRSHTPTMGFYVKRRTTMVFERNSVEEPLLSEQVSPQSAPNRDTKSMLCVASAVTFFFGTFYLQLVQNLGLNTTPKTPNRGVVLKVGRTLLQVEEAASSFSYSVNGSLLKENGSMENSGIGTFLGWGMAAIYMGGRLPQICLNFRRGNVEGLNPLMFIFALVGNATYVARGCIIHMGYRYGDLGRSHANRSPALELWRWSGSEAAVDGGNDGW
ncbi:hypothetical protein LguiB_033335 [Lonicera macranthoides]